MANRPAPRARATASTASSSGTWDPFGSCTNGTILNLPKGACVTHQQGFLHHQIHEFVCECERAFSFVIRVEREQRDRASEKVVVRDVQAALEEAKETQLLD